MVSLAVVVAAILAVVFLAFADQPATALARRRRGPATGPFRARLSAPAQLSPVRMPAGRRGPPPARVLQAGLALPSGRPRTATLTVAAPPVARATTEVPSPVRPPHPLPEMGAAPTAVGLVERVTVWTRLRSSVALLVLLAMVGTVFALAIGAILFLISVALGHVAK